MGVLNVTPDSFSDGGRWYRRGSVALSEILDAAERMVEAGAHLLDVGGESTRPGARPVGVQEEADRVLPVLEALCRIDVLVSLDTSKPEVAAQGIAAGCHLINDVQGLRNPEMVQVLAGSDVGVCLMHMRGEPRSMQADPRYDDVVIEIRDFFERQVQTCLHAGVEPERLALDPGFGFGKALEHNLTLLSALEALRVSDLPLLVGLSRKSMLGTLTGRPVDEREVASAVVAALAVERGADIVRVHDVGSTRDALRLVEALSEHREH